MKYLVIMLLSGVLGCKVLPAQKKGVPACISKINAFSEQHFMGNIPVDENGKPLRSAAFVVYTFYIETKDTYTPAWQLLTTGKDTLTIGATEEISNQTITVGRQKGMAKDFVLQKSTGTHLWKIESGPVEGSVENNNYNSFTLTGTCNGKSFTCPVNGVMPLETPPAP